VKHSLFVCGQSISSANLRGASPCKQRWTVMHSLYSIRCSVARQSWSRSKQATAVLRTDCKRWMSLGDQRIRRYSSRTDCVPGRWPGWSLRVPAETAWWI